MSKKTYRVWAACTSYCYLDVAADSEEEAMDIARDADGGDFMPAPDGDWDVTEAVEL